MKGIAEYCDRVIRSVVMDRYPDVFVEELHVCLDHIHIVIVIPPKYSVSNVVGKIKGDSSRKLRKRFEYLKRDMPALWSIGFHVSSVGLNEITIRRYVEYQEAQDKGQLKAVWDKEATGRA